MGNVVSKNNDDIKHIVLSAMIEVQAKRSKKRVFDCQDEHLECFCKPRGAIGVYQGMLARM